MTDAANIAELVERALKDRRQREEEDILERTLDLLGPDESRDADEIRQRFKNDRGVCMDDLIDAFYLESVARRMESGHASNERIRRTREFAWLRRRGEIDIDSYRELRIASPEQRRVLALQEAARPPAPELVS